MYRKARQTFSDSTKIVVTCGSVASQLGLLVLMLALSRYATSCLGFQELVYGYRMAKVRLRNAAIYWSGGLNATQHGPLLIY